MSPEMKEFCFDVLEGHFETNKSNGQTRKLLKEYLIAEKIFDYKCQECKCLPEHNNKPLVLQLDHTDGNPKNNTKHNLRWLCPNCHSQTHSFAGRNTSGRKRNYTPEKVYTCQICSKEYSLQIGKKNKKFCSITCSGISKQKIDWKNIDIKAAISEHGIKKLEKMWGVSNVAIYKQRDRQT